MHAAVSNISFPSHSHGEAAPSFLVALTPFSCHTVLFHLMQIKTPFNPLASYDMNRSFIICINITHYILMAAE